MTDNCDAKVPIKKELKKLLPFGIEARLATATVLGFVGYDYEVTALVQTLSHGTRAYMVNADFLSGFLKGYELEMLLLGLAEAGHYEKGSTLQNFKIVTVVENLMQQSSKAKKLDYLSQVYPNLYVDVLEIFRQYDKIDEYMAKCKEYEDDPCNYSYYVHGYLLTLLDQKLKAGELKKGKPVV